MAVHSTATVTRLRPAPALGPRHGLRSGGPVDGGREEPLISNGRLAVLMLIFSEAMLFSGLIGSFLVYKLGAPFWPPPGLPHLPLVVTSINTAILLASGVTMAMAVLAVRHNRRTALVRLLGVTLALGAIFLGVQGSEWVRLVAHGLKLSTGVYGATFYVLIGCHGFHVLCAVVWLACVLYAAARGRYNRRNFASVEICSFYWYFVCAIWPALFYLVYL